MLWTAERNNTQGTLEIAVAQAIKQDIKHIVVASNTGKTAQMLKDLTPDGSINLVCVSHHVGFKEPGHDEMAPETRNGLKEQGIPVLTTTHVLAGVDRALRMQFGGVYPPEIIANSLRMLGQGVKVCVEISIMALDAGLIPYGEEIIAIGGWTSGADTAAIIRPAHSTAVFETKIVDIICRPRI